MEINEVKWTIFGWCQDTVNNDVKGLQVIKQKSITWTGYLCYSEKRSKGTHGRVGVLTWLVAAGTCLFGVGHGIYGHQLRLKAGDATSSTLTKSRSFDEPCSTTLNAVCSQLSWVRKHAVWVNTSILKIYIQS